MKNEMQKTREYLNYIEEHYNNVQKAWKIIQEKCKGKGFNFLYDDFLCLTLDQAIKDHDKSKLCGNEFIQYRRWFYPVHATEKSKQEFDNAWEHHKKENDHHWENWATKKETFPNEISLCVVHNVCDWMAMGMKFGDTAKEYYEKNKGTIIVPKWSEKLMYKIFDCVKEQPNDQM